MSLLSPGEDVALTIARAQVQRGESPTPNIAAVVVMTLDRLVADHAVATEANATAVLAAECLVRLISSGVFVARESALSAPQKKETRT